MKEPRAAARIGCMLLAAVLLLLPGCARQEEDSRLHVLHFQSEILGKEMISQVYLPEDYDETKLYPVLYFLPGGGGSSYMVINQFGIREAYDRLAEAEEIEPMILVAMGIDLSFGMNTAAETGRVEMTHEYTFDQGRYEDFILLEMIPEIEGRFAVSGRREERFIGGYSMGGLAALHVAMRSPELFGRAGGHSPTLFIDDDIDLAASPAFPVVRDFLYPTEELHRERDPLYLAESVDLTGLSVYLDTGPADVNARALAALAEALESRGVDVRMQLLSGAHSASYCNTYMREYLRFYAGAGP